MLKKIVLFTLIGIALFWMTIVISGYHFYSVDVPIKIPWILILLLGIYLYLSTKHKTKRITVSVLFSIVLLLYVPIIWFGYGLIGIEGDLKIIKCESCNKKVISYFHQGPWGGTPLETTGIGEMYLGGIIYKTTIDTTYFAEYQYAMDVDSSIVIPKDINPKDLVFVWSGQSLLLVFKNGEEATCLPLKYKDDKQHANDN